MNSLLTTMMGGVTGPLMRAGLFPAAIFTTLLLLLVVPLAPDSLDFFAPLLPVSTEWRAAGVLFLTVVVAGLLYAMNTSIVRLYEGYPWRSGLLGRFLQSVNVSRLRRLRTTLEGATRLRSQLGKGTRDRAAIVDQISALKLQLRYDFPERDDLVLPTRLGNTIRSAERYSSVEYGIEAIILWPHFQAAMHGGGYATKLDEGQSNLSFLLNTAFSLLVLAALLVLEGLLSPAASMLNTMLPAALLVLVSSALYRGAIGVALSWGYLVRGAFDMYREKAMASMGYGKLPSTRVAERKRWRDITAQLLFGDKEQYPEEMEPRPKVLTGKTVRPRLDPVPSTEAVPTIVSARGVRRTSEPGVLEVVVRATNDGSVDTGPFFEVTEKLPEGFVYVWDSVDANGTPVTVRGEGPYTFRIKSTLAHEASLEFTYLVLDLLAERRPNREAGTAAR